VVVVATERGKLCRKVKWSSIVGAFCVAFSIGYFILGAWG
jgi:hypothetical protein